MNRYTPTAEQKEAARLRRLKMRDLSKKIAAMSEAERSGLAASIGSIFTIEGRALSLHNICMIACQLPAATLVGGFRQWRQHGRKVRKGEHGAAIWCPVGARKDDAAPSDAELDGDKPSFLLGTVFDVAQTEEIAAAQPVETKSELIAA